MRTNHWKMPLLILLTGLCAIVTIATAPMTQAESGMGSPMMVEPNAMTVPEVADLTDADVALSTNYSTVDISYSRLYALTLSNPKKTDDGRASTVVKLATACNPTPEGTATDKTAGLVTNRLVDNTHLVQDIIVPKNADPPTQHNVFQQHTRLGGATRAP